QFQVGDNFRLQLDANGSPHIFYYLADSGIYEIERSAQGNWLEPRRVSNISPESGTFDLTFDTANRLHVAWWKPNGLYYAMRENNTWREERIVDSPAVFQQGI